MEKIYVLGLAFNEKRDHVVLIHKDRPEWQKGLLNGIGGKFEEDIDVTYAKGMAREFKEETGLVTQPGSWDKFAVMAFTDAHTGGDGYVIVFRYFSDRIFLCKTQESEAVEIFCLEGRSNYKKLSADHKKVPHLDFLIYMARNPEVKLADIKLL